jgi:hypothetical protein
MEERERCYSFILSPTPHETAYGCLDLKNCITDFDAVFLKDRMDKGEGL